MRSAIELYRRADARFKSATILAKTSRTWFNLAVSVGLEPTTSALTEQCSSHLS